MHKNMGTINLQTLTPEELARILPTLSSEKLQENAPRFSHDMILMAVSILNSDHEREWKSRLGAFIRGLTDYKALEYAGKGLDRKQALEILHQFSTDLKEEVNKLSPLLVGMQHGVFTDLLLEASPQEMQLLRQEAVSEPVQHQLTVLTHEIVRQIPAFGQELENLHKTIQGLQVNELSHRDLLALTDALHQAAEFFAEINAKCDRILALAWNTSRVDLIDKLSHAKELSARYLQQVVGHPRLNQIPATGLHALLEKQLNSVYGNPDDPKDIEAVDEDEPALEALVKFSIWYVTDYWNIGLLPHVKDPQLLSPVPGELSPKKRQALHTKLLETARNNLEKMGLVTAKDLKTAGIYSKATLQEYIALHLPMILS